MDAALPVAAHMPVGKSVSRSLRDAPRSRVVAEVSDCVVLDRPRDDDGEAGCGSESIAGEAAGDVVEPLAGAAEAGRGSS